MSKKNTQNKSSYKFSEKTVKSDSNSSQLVKSFLWKIGITNETEENILKYIIKNLPKQRQPYYIVTPNPEMVVLANKNIRFKTILNNAKIALPDGMQLVRAAQIVGVPLKGRIIGTDFVEKLCEKVHDRPITVGFLGGQGKIAERASECLRQKYPGLKVVFASKDWNENFRGPVATHPTPMASFTPFTAGTRVGSPSRATPSHSEHKPSTINHQHIDILFVAFGFPKQEEWMAEHIGKIPVKVMMGVGGALDQIVDPTLRPPTAVHQLGLGWLYRLVRQPWRVKRQAKLLEFVGMVVKEKFIQN